MDSELYRVVLPYAVFGVVARGNLVAETAPIGKWMLGKPLNAIRAWVIGKRGTLEHCA